MRTPSTKVTTCARRDKNLEREDTHTSPFPDDLSCPIFLRILKISSGGFAEGCASFPSVRDIYIHIQEYMYCIMNNNNSFLINVSHCCNEIEHLTLRMESMLGANDSESDRNEKLVSSKRFCARSGGFPTVKYRCTCVCEMGHTIIADAIAFIHSFIHLFVHPFT